MLFPSPTNTTFTLSMRPSRSRMVMMSASTWRTRAARTDGHDSPAFCGCDGSGGAWREPGTGDCSR